MHVWLRKVISLRVKIDEASCEGHGRCYALAPALFEPDEIGNASVLGDGIVPAGEEDRARRAVANCPEHAIAIDAST